MKLRLITAACFFFLLGNTVEVFGLRFIRNYTRNDGFTRSGYIKDIAVARDYVYFGTSNGILILNFKTGVWQQFHSGNSPLPSNYIAVIAVDDALRRIWIGTDAGIAMYAPDEKEEANRWRIYQKKDGLPDNEITALAVDKEYIWAGTRYWGITRFDKRLNRWRPKPYTPIDGLGSTRIYDLAVDGNDIWAATDDGLSLFDRYTDLWTTFNAKQGLSAKQVTCISSDGKGIWAGTYGGGLNYFDKETFKFKVFRIADGLADDTVFTVRCDGNYVWVGTFSGVSRYDKTVDSNNWQTINRNNLKLVDNAVTSIALDGNRIWFGTDGEGVTLIDKLTPQAVITGDTGYTKPGNAEIYITVKDASPIRSYSIGYRAAIYANRPLETTGLKLVNTAKITGSKDLFNIKAAEWNISGLKEGLVYDIVLQVENSRGQKNSFVFPFIVDNTPPVMNLQPLPEAVKTPEVFIRGNYLELQLQKIELSVNGSPFQRVSIVDRKRRNFRHKVVLRTGRNRIRVRVEDLGRHRVTAERTVTLDQDGPEIIFEGGKTKFVSPNPDFLLKAAIKEKNLAFVYLNPGKINLPVKPLSNEQYSVEQKLDLKKGTNSFVLIAVDKSGTRSEKKVEVLYNSAAPRLDLDENLPEKTGSPFYDVRGKWLDKDLQQITVEPGNVKAAIDKEKGTFEARVELKKGFNVIRVTAMDEEGNSNSVVLQVIYEEGYQKKLSVEDQLKDARKNYQLFVQYKKKYDDLLDKYQLLLKELEKLKYEMKHGKTVPGTDHSGPFIPPGSSLYLVRYDRASGDTMRTVARKYLGTESAAGIIARLNNDLSADFFTKSGRLVIPTGALLQQILASKQQTRYLLLVDLAAEAFHLGLGRVDLYTFRKNLMQFVQQRGLLKASAGNIALHLKTGGTLLIVAGGSLDYRRRQLERLMVANGSSIGYIVYFRNNYLQFFGVDKR